MRKTRKRLQVFKKASPPSWKKPTAQQTCGKPIEIWFQDEARIGQKNKITRRWAKRGTRPSAPRDQRTASAYIFGAICPAEGKGAGLVLPSCNSEAMALHLEEISRLGITRSVCSNFISGRDRHQHAGDESRREHEPERSNRECCRVCSGIAEGYLNRRYHPSRDCRPQDLRQHH